VNFWYVVALVGSVPNDEIPLGVELVWYKVDEQVKAPAADAGDASMAVTAATGNSAATTKLRNFFTFVLV
jgi:hypothetical protein